MLLLSYFQIYLNQCMILIALFCVYQKEYSMASNQWQPRTLRSHPTLNIFLVLFLARIYMAVIAPFSRLSRPHSATDCVVKLIFFMNNYYRRVERTNNHHVNLRCVLTNMTHTRSTTINIFICF